MKTIQVAMGLIVNHNNEILMTLRGKEQSRPSMWELPGGRIELFDTSPAHAVARELFEELDIQAEVGELIDTWDVVLEHPFHMECFVAWIRSGQPRPLAAAEMEWVNIHHAIVRRPCVPSTYQFYEKIRDYLDRHPWRKTP